MLVDRIGLRTPMFNPLKTSIMTKNDTIFNAIEGLFQTLPQSQQVSLMVSLYYSMDDGQKDKFLHETENG